MNTANWNESLKIAYTDIAQTEHMELYNALSILLLENETQDTNHYPIICWKKSELKFYWDLILKWLGVIEVPDWQDNLEYAAQELKKWNIHAILAWNISDTGHVITVGKDLIWMQEWVKRASSYFLMEHPDYGKYIFADSWCQPNPKPEQLIEIVKLTCENARIHWIETKVALLDGWVASDKIQEVSKYFEENPIPWVEILGNMSFKDAQWEECKIFIFPDLNAGNIAYKVAERMQGYTACDIQEDEASKLWYQEVIWNDDSKHIFAYHTDSKNPSVDELVETALSSIDVAREKWYPLQVAFLCFSTAWSWKDSPTIISSRQAAQKLISLLAERWINDVIVLDKEVQFDTAFLPEKAKKKGMEVSDPSTIFIMPDIHSWRMMWDIAQSLWWSSANGPNLQWFKQMINDFSRGVWTNDIVIRHKTTEHELSK